MADLHNLRMVSEDFGYLVEKDANEPCCQGCLADYDAEIVQQFSDYCCCVHGEKYATVYKGKVSWIEDGSEARYEKNRATSTQPSEEG